MPRTSVELVGSAHDLASQNPVTQDETEAEDHITSPVSTVEEPDLSRTQALAVISCVVCATGINSLLSGLVTVIIPQIAEDLHLGPHLTLWNV